MAERRAQLLLALAYVSYMDGEFERSRAQAEAVLAELGLPTVLHDAAERIRLLCLVSDGSVTGPGYHANRPGLRPIEGCPSAELMVRAAQAWRCGCIDDALGLLWAADQAGTVSQPGAGCPALGLAAVFAALGELEGAQACVVHGADVIARSGDPLWAAAPALYSARLGLLAGRLDEAADTARSGLDRVVALQVPLLAPMARHVLFTAALLRGELVEAAAQLAAWEGERLDGRMPFGSHHRHWAAILLRDAQGAAPLSDGPAGALFDLAANDRGLLVEEPGAAAWLVRLASRAEDRDRVHRVVGIVTGLAEANARYPSVRASMLHAVGVARREPTVIEAAAATYRSLWARASAAEDVAELRDMAGEREPVRAWLERAEADYRSCGAVCDSARILARLRGLGVRKAHWRRQPHPVCGWDSLTETERAVSSLVAEGLTNQQIAARMFLSRHTVDFHLRHIFRKLGIGSRVVLARMALVRHAAEA